MLVYKMRKALFCGLTWFTRRSHSNDASEGEDDAEEEEDDDKDRDDDDTRTAKALRT